MNAIHEWACRACALLFWTTTAPPTRRALLWRGRLPICPRCGKYLTTTQRCPSSFSSMIQSPAP